MQSVQKMRMHDALEKNRPLAVFGMILVAVAFVGVSSVVVVNTEASTSVYRGSKRGRKVVGPVSTYYKAVRVVGGG